MLVKEGKSFFFCKRLIFIRWVLFFKNCFCLVLYLLWFFFFLFMKEIILIIVIILFVVVFLILIWFCLSFFFIGIVIIIGWLKGCGVEVFVVSGSELFWFFCILIFVWLIMICFELFIWYIYLLVINWYLGNNWGVNILAIVVISWLWNLG